MRLELSRGFESDLEAIVDYFLTSAPGQAKKLRDAVFKSLERIASHPYRGRWIQDDLRAEEIRGTRFRVLYSIEVDFIAVLALEDTRREPGYWKDRVR